MFAQPTVETLNYVADTLLFAASILIDRCCRLGLGGYRQPWQWRWNFPSLEPGLRFGRRQGSRGRRLQQ
jgi:hypothetical protein